MTITLEEFLGRSEPQSSATTVQLLAGSPRLQSITMTATSQSVRMPIMRAAGRPLRKKGASWLIENAGTNDFTIKDKDGADIDSPAVTVQGSGSGTPQAAWVIWYDDGTSAGSWRHTLFDVTTGSTAPQSVFGYLFGQGSNDREVWEFNQVLDEWTQKTSGPFEISGTGDADTACQRNETSVYFHETDLISAEETYSYGETTDAWAHITDDPGRGGVPFAAMGHYTTDDEIWAFGIEGAASSTFDNEIYKLDVSGGTGTQVTSTLPESLRDTAWAEVLTTDDKIYIFHAGAGNASTFEYDFSSATMTQQDDALRGARDLHSGFRLPDTDAMFDVMGRIIANTLTSEVWTFDPSASSGQQWTQKSDFTGTARDSFFSWAIDSKGYLYGGHDSSDNDLTDIYEYDAVQDSWTEITPTNSGATNDTRGRAKFAQNING